MRRPIEALTGAATISPDALAQAPAPLALSSLAVSMMSCRCTTIFAGRSIQLVLRLNSNDPTMLTGTMGVPNCKAMRNGPS